MSMKISGIISNIFFVYAVTIVTYLGTSVKSTMDSHTEFQFASVITYALVTGLFAAVSALFVREKKTLNRLELNNDRELGGRKNGAGQLRFWSNNI